MERDPLTPLEYGPPPRRGGTGGRLIRYLANVLLAVDLSLKILLLIWYARHYGQHIRPAKTVGRGFVLCVVTAVLLIQVLRGAREHYVIWALMQGALCAIFCASAYGSTVAGEDVKRWEVVAQLAWLLFTAVSGIVAFWVTGAADS